MAWKPRLRTVVIAMNMLVLVLPIGGIALLRLYESELIQRTESELIAQAAVVVAGYRQEVVSILQSADREAGEKGHPVHYGIPVDPRWARQATPEFPFDPVAPKLDAARDAVRPPAEDATPAIHPPDPVAVRAAERVQPILAAAARVTLAGIRITDFYGTVVASTGSEMGLSLGSREEVARALKGEAVTLLRERIPGSPTPPLESISRRGRVRVFTAMPVVHRDRILGAVVASRTALDIRKALYVNRRYLLGGGLALIAVVLVVSTLTSLTMSRPVRALIRQAEQVTRGEQAAARPLARPGTREVDRLSRALADMSVMLQKRAQYIRTFASNVSHEFKTPLTSMRASIELLADQFEEMSSEDRNRFLEILRKDTERLERLVHRLLELARADVLQPGNETTHVAGLIDRLSARYRGSGLTVVVEHDPKVDTVRMAAETLESILSNILENARQHGGDHVEVTVATTQSAGQEPRYVELVVTDNGKGIPDGQQDQVFKPFYTTGRDRGSTGLGLSIVKALVTAHGGEVSLEPSKSGARFFIRLPA